VASTSKRLDHALKVLKSRGREVATNPGALVGPDGILRIPIDGRPRTVEEIYALAAMPGPLKCPKCSGSNLQVRAIVTELAPDRKNWPGLVSKWLPVKQLPDGQFTGEMPQRWHENSNMLCLRCGLETKASEFGLLLEVELNQDDPRMLGRQMD